MNIYINDGARCPSYDLSDRESASHHSVRVPDRSHCRFPDDKSPFNGKSICNTDRWTIDSEATGRQILTLPLELLMLQLELHMFPLELHTIRLVLLECKRQQHVRQLCVKQRKGNMVNRFAISLRDRKGNHSVETGLRYAHNQSQSTAIRNNSSRPYSSDPGSDFEVRQEPLVAASSTADRSDGPGLCFNIHRHLRTRLATTKFPSPLSSQSPLFASA